MNIVAEVIANYLQVNRKLVVPAFGAFMVKESGERVFSNLLNDDDGILTSLLRERGLNEMETAVTIDRFIFEVRHELELYGYCRLGEIGTLRIEPTTKVLKLYPPVQGEMPKQTPYIPKRISEMENENRDAKAETIIPSAPTMSEKPSKHRRKVDFVMIVAVIILLAALVGIGYGWYVSHLAEFDDAAIDALRVIPEQVKE